MATSPLFTPDFHIPACQHQEPLNTLEKIPDFLSARFSPPSILGDYADKLEEPSRRDVCVTIFIPEFFSSGGNGSKRESTGAEIFRFASSKKIGFLGGCIQDA